MEKKIKRQNRIFLIGMVILIYIIAMFLILHITTVQYRFPNMPFSDVLDQASSDLVSSPFDIEITPDTGTYVAIATGGAFIVGILIFANYEKNQHDKAGVENGSAHWCDDMPGYNKQYADPIGTPSADGPKNMILSNTVRLSMESFKTRRNCNICVVGGSGSGKSRFFVKPNVLQANSNYVITDPSGELLEATGTFLKEQGYDIKIFNLVEMSKSNCYNPFHYIRDENGVLMMINCLIRNTNPSDAKGGDPFWEKSETALLQAICFYLIDMEPPEKRNFSRVMEMLRMAEVDENNPNKKSALDLAFLELEAKKPNSVGVKAYKTFKMGAGKTLKSILISCAVRLTVFNLEQVKNLTRIDNIHLEELGGSVGNEKQALFVIIPAADATFNFLVSMMYSQLFETLYFTAETQCAGKRLPRHVRFMLDEFVNIGQIPEFTKKLATMRKYEISCSVILQNIAQIKALYKDDWETIIGNSDTFIFLGGSEYSTLEYISKQLGNETIRVRDTSFSSGKHGSGSKSFKQTSRSLMFPDELGQLNDECVVQIRGLPPFRDKKFDYPKHPNYKYTGDADKSRLYVNTMDNSQGIDLSAINAAAEAAQNADLVKERPWKTRDIDASAAIRKETEQMAEMIFRLMSSAPQTASSQELVDADDFVDYEWEDEPFGAEDVPG